MSDDDREAYVNRILERNQNYTRELLSENRELKLALAAVDVERKRLTDRAQRSEAVARENGDLRSRLEASERALDELRSRLARAEASVVQNEETRQSFERRLEEIESESRHYLEQFIYLEQQNTNLANLYVASYRLHSTLDPADVVAAISEIIVNLIGSENFAIFALDRQSRELRLEYGFGVDADALATIPLDTTPLGELVKSGDLHAPDKPDQTAPLAACIPLKLGDTVTGAIALFALLPHKADLGELDRELFALLATHAASALYSAKLHASLATAQPEVLA